MAEITLSDGPAPRRQASSVLVEARDIVQEFAARGAGGTKAVVRAVSGVSLEIRLGETLGVVGETGSGKSTLARAILQSPPPKSGTVVIDGVDLTKLHARELREARRKMQMVYQDPFGSLDSRWRVGRIVAEPLDAYGIGSRPWRRKRVDELLDLVGLDPASYRSRRPRELSGGQCQRVAIARALAIEPRLLICDEAVSSLDVLIQSQVLDLFAKLRKELGLSYLFIAHDLAVVNEVSDRVAVMYLGRLCEVGPAEALYSRPRHPYTRALLDAIPSVDFDGQRADLGSAIRGEPPSPLAPPSGCRFRTRCPRAEALCASSVPQLRVINDDHYVACHFPLEGAHPRSVAEEDAAHPASRAPQREAPGLPPMARPGTATGVGAWSYQAFVGGAAGRCG